MGSEETRTDASRPGSNDTAKVVRIPRDWFGPKEDLVPFGPRAWAEEEQANERPAETPVPPVPLDAETFWGEDAVSVQDVLEGPPERQRWPRLSGRTIAVAALVAAMSAVGLGTWLSSGSRPRPVHSAVAAVTIRYRPAPSVVRRSGGVAHRVRSPARRHAQKRRAAAQPISTPVVYHPTPATATQTAPATSTSGASVASAAPASPQPQPAFGANGALGPMSSPDG